MTNGGAAPAPAPDAATATRSPSREPRPEPVPRARARERFAPAPAYGRHESRRGRPAWLVPLLALLALALVAGAIALLSGGDSGNGGENASSGDSQQAEKPKEEKEAPRRSAPDEEQQATAPSSYEVPQPGGDDAAGGARQNAQGKQLLDAGNYDEAIPVLEGAVRSFPAGTSDLNYAYALFNLGQALRKGGRPGDAVPVLEERLKIDNQRATVQRELDLAKQRGRG